MVNGWTILVYATVKTANGWTKTAAAIVKSLSSWTIMATAFARRTWTVMAALMVNLWTSLADANARSPSS